MPFAVFSLPRFGGGPAWGRCHAAIEARKFFFSEEKKQKTLRVWSELIPQGIRAGIKKEHLASHTPLPLAPAGRAG